MNKEEARAKRKLIFKNAHIRTDKRSYAVNILCLGIQTIKNVTKYVAEGNGSFPCIWDPSSLHLIQNIG